MKKLILTILLMLMPFVAHGEVFVLNDFSGGLDEKVSAFRMPVNKGDLVDNIRFDESLGALTKRDRTTVYGTADASEAITGLYRLYTSSGEKVLIATHGNSVKKGDDSDGSFTNILTVSSSDQMWSFLTWHDILIGCDGTNSCIKYDGSSSSATYLGTALALDAGTGAGPNGAYTYKVTCYTSSYEVSMDQASNSVTVSDNDINLSMIPICPETFLGETVTGRKVYRTEASGSTYKLLSNGTIADNSTVILTDSDADGALGATLSPTSTYTTPKGRFPVIHKNRLWLGHDPSNPSRAYYSEDGLHDFFLSDAFFNIRPNDGDEITFVKNILGKLAVGKTNTIQYIHTDGADPTADWAISDPYSFIGCHAPYSAVNTSQGIIYLGNNGLYVFNGVNSTLISDAVTPVIKRISPTNYNIVWGTYYKNKYLMSYTDLETGGTVNNRILIFDFLSNAYSIDILSRNVLTVFGSGTDIEALFSGGSEDGKVYAHTDTVNEVIHRRHADFTGDFQDMRYVPVSAGGDAEDPILELAWTLTVDQAVGTIDNATGIIDRPDTDGAYYSQYLTVNAASFEKLFWNEQLPEGGGDVTFALRSGSTAGGLASVPWSSEYTFSSGSDISAVTGDTVLQYRVTMNTDNITTTPYLVKNGDYVIRITYDTFGATDETSIPLRWRSGWLDFGFPNNAKSLEKVYAYYETESGSTGTLNLTVENFQGDSDVFPIDYFTYPAQYINFFTGGKFVGNLFRVTLEEDSLNPITIKKLVFRFTVEPEEFKFPE